MDYFCAGRAVLLTGGHFGPPHLWFILTDPDTETGQVVATMVVTNRQHTDKTVVLQAGEHPFIKHGSCVDYGGARLLKVSRLQAGLKTNQCRPEPDMSKELLARVRAGLLTSSRTVHWLTEYCKRHFSP